MNIKSWAFAALAASVVLGATGCGTNSTPQARTPIPSAAAPGQSADSAPATIAPPPASVPVDQKEPATSPQNADQGPNGSGHGLCFDVNSELAHNAIQRLAPPPVGSHAEWEVVGSGTEPISSGCSGVLSYLTVEWQGIHPATHILFFANGTWLGTATSKPYSYTQVQDRTRSTLNVQYRWATPQDALCCPSGGPSTVTYTLNGTTVQAHGQFPPDN
ncbi:LppP/LprE family lipoprotein [Nocardia sp. NPDC060256]|uniref:LppP/LprE family lipoprotein n=1 Tax=unclassified Nocardia TaxID=2637762 RepID=UPI0036568B46